MYCSFLRRVRRSSLPALFVALIMTAGGSLALAGLPDVPDGFKIRLVAAVPAVHYPCQVTTAPDGSLFVGEDPMDQVGPADKPIDRILLFRDGKEPVVFAEKLNAIYGMVWHDGALYVMNMPHLTVFRDKDGDGKADERKELFTDLGVPAGSPNDFNDHIVSGLKIGIDRYLYISVGDKGVPKATGPDGRTAQVKGGGVLRCRLDGTGLEVFSTGTRNHLEPNLDDRDNLFTYDNTDDGLGWWTRVTHHIDGGYYGYPFDYHTRTDRMLPRMAEYGGGSPCGGVFYGEDAWPEKYHGLLFWAEWGQRVVRAIRFEPAGSTFKVAEKIDFVEHGKVDDFRPLDLALSHDGKTMYIADWSLGSWGNKTEKLGRVYAVTYEGKPARTRRRGNDSDPIATQIRQLVHASFNERSRAQTALTKKGKDAVPAITSALADSATSPMAKRHLIWALDAIAGGTPEASYPLIDALASPNRDVRAQAARALGERAVPIAIEPLVKRLKDGEPTVRLQALIALGRIGSAEAIPAILPLVAETDVFLAYSARQALRRIGDWPVAAHGLDSPDPKIRAGTLLAMDQVYDVAASSWLAEFAGSAKRPIEERVKALEYLSEVDRKSPPWDGKWWGTQPAKGAPPARTIAWDGTPGVMATIRELTTDKSPPVRTAAIEALTRVHDGDSARFIRGLFAREQDPGVKSAIAVALGKLADTEALDLLTSVLWSPHYPEPVRDAALEAVEKIGSKKAVVALADLLARKALSVERQPRVIKALGKFKDLTAVVPLLEALKSPSAPVRESAIDALVAIVKDTKEPKGDDVAAGLRALLTDPSGEVRNRAIAATGAIGDRQAIPALIALADKTESSFEAGMALAELPDIRGLQVYLHGLTAKNSELRTASAAAIGKMRDQAAKVLDQLAARNELSPATLPELRSIFAGLSPISSWNVLGPFPIEGGPTLAAIEPFSPSAKFEGVDGKPVTWKTAAAVDKDGQIDLGRVYTHEDDRAAYGYAEVTSTVERQAQMVVGSDDTLTVWVNGKQVYDFSDRRGFSHDQDRFDVTLLAGTNRILVRCGNRGGPWQFSVAVTAQAEFSFLKAPVSEGFDPETYRVIALKGQGSASRGRQLFADLKGLACVKCHAVGKEGGAVGPELSSVGAKYPRDELIASVLYPSAKISSGFEPMTFAMADGRMVTGLVRKETDAEVEIQDSEAKLIRLAKDQIEERKRSDVSVMPNGLAKGLSPADFADLIAYLETLKNVDSETKMKAPKAEVIPKKLESFGHVRVDPYYWLKERTDPKVTAYLEAENAYTESVMAPTKPFQKALYDEIVGRIKQADATAPVFDNGYYYYTRFETGKQYPFLVRKKGSLEAAEEVLLDENALATGQGYFSVGAWEVSPDNRLLAFAVDTGGRRFFTIRIKDLVADKMLGETIDQVTENLAWANDSRTLFYTKQDPSTLRAYRIHRHTVGAHASADSLVYEEADDTFSCRISRTKSDRYLMISSRQTLSTEYRYLDADKPAGAFRVIEPRRPGLEYSADHLDDHFYIRTNLDAKNFRLMEAPIDSPGQENWREVVAHRADIFLQGFELFRDFLVLEERREGLCRLRVHPWSGEPEHQVEFGEPTYLARVGPNREMNTSNLRFVYTSLTTPMSSYDYDMSKRLKTLVKREEILGGFDPVNYVTERLHATAPDGTKIPISIVYRKGFPKDGTRPLLLYGYGSYGASMDASFQSERLSLLDRGFAFAIAHVRGGQELGRHWYESGKLKNKRNTFTDFIACAVHLIDSGYTKPEHLFAQGGSAGGLLMGAVINMRPDLWKGVIAAVPFVDVVTTMLDSSIPLTTFEYDEWGNPANREYFEYMLSYSPYDNVVAKAYPNMLVTTALEDSQVQYWEPAKWVAKLRATKTDTNLLLLRTYMQGSHGGVSGRYKRYLETAFGYAFLLNLAGIAK